MKKVNIDIYDSSTSNRDVLEALCHEGDVERIRLKLGTTESNPTYNDDLKFLITKGFKTATYYGFLNLVKYLLTDPSLPEHADIHYDEDYAVTLSSFNGHIDVVKYLLTSPELKEHASITGRANRTLVWTCEAGELAIAEYLLTSPDLKEHCDINSETISGNNAFIAACDQNKLDILKLLWAQPTLDREKALYSYNRDYKSSFEAACENHEKDEDIVKFLITECNIKLTKKSKEYIELNLERNPIVTYAKKLLEARDHVELLKATLEQKDAPIKKLKL